MTKPYPTIEEVEKRAGVHPSRWDQYPDRIIKAACDLDRERREAPADDVGGESIDWAAHPKARWAMKDSEGFVRMANDADRPVTIGEFWFARGGTYILGIGTHIPGPWQESLRARPENV